MLTLSCDELVELILSDDALNSNSEEPVWELCLRWIEFDEENRLQYVPRLLENVRLGLMKKDVIRIIIDFRRKIIQISFICVFFFLFCSTSNDACLTTFMYNYVQRRNQS